MNYKQQEEKIEKLLKTLETYRKFKSSLTSIKELSDKLGKGFSTSTLQRYFHELFDRKMINEEEYKEICSWLNNNKIINRSIGGKISQEKYGYSKDELGHFNGGKKI